MKKSLLLSLSLLLAGNTLAKPIASAPKYNNSKTSTIIKKSLSAVAVGLASYACAARANELYNASWFKKLVIFRTQSNVYPIFINPTFNHRNEIGALAAGSCILGLSACLLAYSAINDIIN